MTLKDLLFDFLDVVSAQHGLGDLSDGSRHFGSANKYHIMSKTRFLLLREQDGKSKGALPRDITFFMKKVESIIYDIIKVQPSMCIVAKKYLVA